MFGAVADLNGNTQTEKYEDTDDDDGDVNIERLTSLIEELLQAARPEGQRIRGIGVGVPSIVRVPEGYVEWAQKLKWRGLQLIKILSDRFSEQIFVENDVNLAAVGESGFGAGQGVDCMACVVVGAGTGAGIMFKAAFFAGIRTRLVSSGGCCTTRPYPERRFARLGKLENLANPNLLVLCPN
jgi:predicted NBD/HSP70 family sugar kinase